MKSFSNEMMAVKQARSRAKIEPQAVTFDGDRYYSVSYQEVLDNPDFAEDDILCVFDLEFHTEAWQ
jgi:hypothetical protein